MKLYNYNAYSFDWCALNRREDGEVNMELRILRNYLTVVEEGGVTAAADVLRISQPALSRQIKELERELGSSLFVRGNRARELELTDAGRLMYRRAQEIVDLSDRAKAEILAGRVIVGDVRIAAAQSAVMRIVARAAVLMRERHPRVTVCLHDDSGANIVERLDSGLADFGVLVQPVDMGRYGSLPLPGGDPMGLLMRHDHPFASRTAVTAKDLEEVPLIMPKGVLGRGDLSGWLGRYAKRINVVGTMNLMYNASCFVREGFACAVGPQDMVDTSPDSGLCFRPFEPAVSTRLAIAWKNGQPLSPAAEAFLEALQDVLKPRRMS